ncbi:MAG: efflux transporter outer membrane subunit [Planctomycetota bacterium]
MSRYLFPVFIGLLTAMMGCAAAPEIKPPKLEMALPSQWSAQATIEGEINAQWWLDFDDPGLDQAVRRVLESNYDLKAASARLSQAVAQAMIAGADLKPTADLGFNASRRRQNFIGLPIPGSGGGVTSSLSTTFGVSLNLSWELDLWGRLRSGAEAALADVQATQADLHGACLSMAGQCVKAWLLIAETSQQIDLAEATLLSYSRSLKQVQSRFESGIRPSLDVRLALSNLEDAKAALADRRLTLDRSVRQLEILMGGYPGCTLEIPRALPPIPSKVPAGLPAALISRRPDLAAAERRLAASRARLDKAEASLYPRISLTASGGTSSNALGDLLDGDFRVWALAGNLTQPLFEGHRLRAGVDQAEAGAEESLAAYAGAALSAFAEVETALAGEAFLAERIDHLSQAATQAEAARNLAEERYRMGLEDYITVLDSQRSALSMQSRLLSARRVQLENRVDLYLALGGGFDISMITESARSDAAAGSFPEDSEL